MYNISSHVHVYIMFEVLKFNLNFKTKNIIIIDFFIWNLQNKTCIAMYNVYCVI